VAPGISRPSHTYGNLADILNFIGRPEEAISQAEQALRLNPRGLEVAWYLSGLGNAYLLTGRIEEAIATQKQALVHNPNFIFSYMSLASSYVSQWDWQLSQDPQTLEQALTMAQKAIALNDSFPWAHMILGNVYLWQKQYDKALAEMERAVALDPNEALTSAALAVVLTCMGRTGDALQAAAQAQPAGPSVADGHLVNVGAAYAMAGHYEEAREPLRRYLSHYPNILPAHLMLAAVYGELGQAAEAQQEAAEVLQLNPNFSLEVYKQRMPIKDPGVGAAYYSAA
jgi:tetratricopeptide (TPR) repeat protein